MVDRYTKAILTVIAAALVYLCIVVSPLPGVAAQTAKRPGDPTGPAEMVIVGWRASDPVPVAFQRPMPVTIGDTVRITGAVSTERSAGAADRVVIAGWEESASREKPGRMRPINDTAAIPVAVQQR